VRNDEGDQSRDTRCGVVKEESDKPLKCVIAKTLPLAPFTRKKEGTLRQPKHEESKNKAQKNRPPWDSNPQP
jgi:hypothetical protein